MTLVWFKLGQLTRKVHNSLEMLGKFKQATKGIPSPFVKNYQNPPGLGTL
jgi:hypothetical protein